MSWFQRFFRRAQNENELEEELRFHLEQEAQLRQDRGEAPEQARQAAQRDFGNVTAVKETTREMWGWTLMEDFLRDLRHALRLLGRSPVFAIVAVLTLGLGIGANTALFSLVNAVILRPLPYSDPEQLVQVYMRFTGIGAENDRIPLSPPETVDLRRNNSFSGLAVYLPTSYNAMLGGEPVRLDAAMVSADFFSTLGAQAQTGRVFEAGEDQLDATPVVVLSDGFWRRRFGADRSVLGRSLDLNGLSYTIAGVMPASFHFPATADVWTPLVFTNELLSRDRRGNHSFWVIGRMKAGLSQAQVDTDMDIVAQRIKEENAWYPYERFDFKVLTIPLLEQEVGNVRVALWVLMGAVGLVLLIACANVANLLLVRASAREREIAVRQALGIGRGRLVRQLLTESILLGILGSAAGLALAYWAIKILINLGTTTVPRIAEASIDLNALGFTLVIALATSVLFGMVPALHTSRQAAHEDLKAGARGSSGGRSRVLRSALVVAQIALSLTLLTGSGLLIRSFLELRKVSGGFRAENVLTMNLSLPGRTYTSPEARRNFYRSLLDSLKQIPNIDAAGAIDALPLSGVPYSGTTTVDTTAVPDDKRYPESDTRAVTEGYFEAMGIELVRGRYFDAHDNENSELVAIIDETMAQTYWPNTDPIGQRIHRGGPGSDIPWRTIVGVVRHVRYRTLEEPSRVEFYWPYWQTADPTPNMSLALHSPSSLDSVAAAVRSNVRRLDPSLPVYGVQTLEQMTSESMALRTLSTFLFTVLAGVAVLLAAIGIYGVISYSVAQRSREVGIRMALGAGGRNVLSLILKQSLLLTAGGIAVGLAASLALTRFLATLLFDVPQSDPVTFVSVGLLLASVALLASFVPARRAARVDPLAALRQE